MELLLIIIVVIALYWRTMDYYCLIDDIVRRWGFLLEIPENSPPPDFYTKKPHKMRHFFLTLTHCVNTSIIYFLWGWPAALLFAVSPICTACTAWITGGYYQITTLFTLTAYYFLVTYSGLTGALLGALFFTAALGSTINCLAIPFIFLVIPPTTGLILFWPLAFYLKGRRFSIGFRKRDIGKGDPITIRKAVVVPKVLAYYIKNVVFPLKLAFFREYGFEYGKDPKVKENLEAINKEFYESIAIVLVFCVVGYALSPIGFFIFMAGLLPFTQWKVLGQFVAERYLYLPMVGWSVMLGSLFQHPYSWPLLFVLAGLYAYRAHKYIPAFRNIETLYENGMDNFPKCISNMVNLAEQKLHKGKLWDAYKLLKQGLELDPKSFLCHANMAAYWLAINQPERGIYHTRMAVKYSDNRGMAYNIFRHQIMNITQGINNMAIGKAEAEKYLAEFRAEESKKIIEESKEVVPCGTP